MQKDNIAKAKKTAVSAGGGDMSWLIVTWFIAFGYVPEQSNKLWSRIESLDPNRIGTSVQIGLSAEMFGRINVFGGIENFQYFNSVFIFDPWRADYSIGATLQLSDNLSITADHVCKHPVDGNTPTVYEASQTRVMVKLEGETRF